MPCVVEVIGQPLGLLLFDEDSSPEVEGVQGGKTRTRILTTTYHGLSSESLDLLDRARRPLLESDAVDLSKASNQSSVRCPHSGHFWTSSN